METEWYVGTLREAQSSGPDAGETTVDLAVQISEEEHEELRTAEAVLWRSQGDEISALVVANHRALLDCEARIRERLTDPKRRGFTWLPAERTQVTVAFANWLSSVRWLLDHTRARYGSEPHIWKRIEDATHREFDNHFAYRFTYKLRDYVTHVDLAPISMTVSTRATGSGAREDFVSLHFVPAELLGLWDDWKARVTRDLRERTEPIELFSLVNDAMASIHRVMSDIFEEDLPEFQAAARILVSAADRLPPDSLEGDSPPFLFVARIDDDGVVRELKPSPLSINQARKVLSLPSKSSRSSRTGSP